MAVVSVTLDGDLFDVAGVPGGWARTGQQFKAYGVGSTGKTTRRPVCRIYGLHSQGLNSHFYSASPDECFATLSNLGAWGLEASEVFEMDLPDATTGACPPGGVPVYRVWNQRYDSNHRYTTSTAIREPNAACPGISPPLAGVPERAEKVSTSPR